MKLKLPMIALVAGLSFAGLAAAQDAPVGGPTAKGNAPLKSTHPVNNGAAKPGANSFTQNEARKHILNSGYTSVSGLTKGKDGIWRGTAMKDGASSNVALDFKGNVTDGGPAAGTMASTTTTASTSTSSKTTASAPAAAGSTAAASDMAATPTTHHRQSRRRHHRSHRKPCMVAGAACSGADKNDDGIADKDEHKTKP